MVQISYKEAVMSLAQRSYRRQIQACRKRLVIRVCFAWLQPVEPALPPAPVPSGTPSPPPLVIPGLSPPPIPAGTPPAPGSYKISPFLNVPSQATSQI